MIQTLSRARARLSAAMLGGFVALAIANPAHAAGSSMPWEAPLQSILESIQGPVAKIVAVMIIIATGLALAFGDTSGGARRMGAIGRATVWNRKSGVWCSPCARLGRRAAFWKW